MTERIDHAAEAWKEWHHMDNPAHESLLHMLNALVEQQRIANLLAYAQFNWKGADDGRIFIGREGVMWCMREAGGRLGVPDD